MLMPAAAMDFKVRMVRYSPLSNTKSDFRGPSN